MAGLPVLRIYNMKRKGWINRRVLVFLLQWTVVLSLSTLVVEQETDAYN